AGRGDVVAQDRRVTRRDVLVSQRGAFADAEVLHVHPVGQLCPELVRLDDLGALTMAAEVERQDGEAFLLQLLREVNPALFLAALAEGVQENRGRRIALAAGIEGAVQIDAVNGLEADLVGAPLFFLRLRRRQQRHRSDGQRYQQQTQHWLSPRADVRTNIN